MSLIKGGHDDDSDVWYEPNPEGWETGYHYTSRSNWERIRLTGLVPTLLSQDKIDALKPLVPEDWDGKAVWSWLERLTPVEHMGSLIYQLAKRRETQIVWLRLQYQFKDRLGPRPDDQGSNRIQLRHNGKIDEYRYHCGTRSCLVVKVVPPRNIELLKVYDLVDLLR